MGKGYGNYQQFKREILGHYSGPLVSAIEDIADDMYNSQVNEEFDLMWDAIDPDDE